MQTQPNFGPSGISFPNAVAAFNFLSPGYERRVPSSYRSWAEVQAEPIRPRMFRATPYRGVTDYYPIPGFVPSAGQPVDIRLRASFFITVLHNPNRVALMQPFQGFWRESHGLFAHSPRQWQDLLLCMNKVKERHPELFEVQVLPPSSDA